MEDFNLDSLSLFLTDELVVVKEEMAQLKLAQKFKNNRAFSLTEDIIEDDLVKEEATSYQNINDIIKELEGGYEKGIIVIYEGTDLDIELQEFLMKILGAVNCSLKDIALLGSDQLENMDPEVLDQLNPQKVLIFGLVHHPIMQHKVELYKIRDVGYELLFANDLVEISTNVALKKSLWASLQTLFHINK
ncbi:MAG TPA: hypothetical protein VK921_02360 [Anditalea sp.]|nr:hypothetical protein [Anditalea sp.]